MATKITQLKLDFEKLRKDGLGKDKIKILNHAVCSGLILLQSTSYYYMLHSAIGASKRSGTLIDVVGRYELKDRNYSVDLWWAGLVWATAATAIHDRYQVLVTKKRSGDKLSFADDPLAFLGILVDEMQFWDRFKVFDLTKDHKFDDVPTQSSEVTLGVQGGKIQFAAPAHEIVTLEKSLNERLSDWRQIVSVTASN